jgi:hypothetical protein
LQVGEFLDHVSEPPRRQPQFEPVRLEVDPLDQQLHDPGLLCGEQLFPQRVERASRGSCK